VLKLSRRQKDHEDVVAEGYAALRRAALYLARGDEAEAGDLLHDTFVRFLLLRPRLDAIGNLDGYLYTMLRNVYLSRQRRHVRRRAVVAETIDIDLLAVMVDEPEPDERLRMRDDLMRLVDHARERTRVSRAASAWLLRCVHGYYPAEIARLMKMPPRGVDRALHVARREALEELRKPARRRRHRDGSGASDGSSSAFGSGERWRDRHVALHGSGGAGDDGAEPLDTLQSLRLRLFASVDGACLTDDGIAELYRPSSDAGADAAGADTAADDGGGSDSDASEPAGTLLMAHVVACAGCLDRINQHLELPPLKTRDPVESSGTRRRRGGDGSGGPGGPGESSGHGGVGGPAGTGPVEHHNAGKGGNASSGGAGLEPLLRRTRDTLATIVNHVPRELRIAANGLELGALPVAGVVTVQELAVRLAESLAFVEIFDERGALVCYWPAQVPRDGMLDDDITIELPDGRSIELRVSLMDDCPRLRVRYTDTRLGNTAHIGDSVAAGARVRDARRSPREAIAEAAHRLRWWERIVPSPRFAIVAGVLAMLWMILIGPTTTWAALGHLGRAAAAVIRSLMPSKPPVTEPAVAPTAPAGSTTSPSAIAPPRASSSARVFSPSELSDLEMAVRIALHDVQADLGEDLTLRSTPAGVAIQGVVDGAARRDSIARAISGLDGARMNVRTADEFSARARASSKRATRAADSTRVTRTINGVEASGAEESPAFANAVQEALAARMPAPADRAAFVNETLARADDALARAWALRRLAERYQPRDITGLSPRSSQSLAALVDDHTATLRTAVDVLVTRVTPLVAAAEALEDKATSATSRGVEASGASGVASAAAAAGSGTSREPRMSIMEMFTLVNAWHTDAHALLAGASPANASVARAATPDPLSPDAGDWLIRLHRIQDALKQPGFGHATFIPASPSPR
jgi:RNA polymerase sigma factor (sigma-70 family)